MKEINYKITAKLYTSVEELDNETQMLIEKAKLASTMAYAPYSHFKVGAAVLLEDGTIITGNNQENAAYPSGLCAERVAVFATYAQHPNAVIKAIAITAQSDDFQVDTPVTPCGACRQVLAEYETKSGKDIQLIFTGKNAGVLIVNSVKMLLPFVFDGSNLKAIKKINKKNK